MHRAVRVLDQIRLDPPFCRLQRVVDDRVINPIDAVVEKQLLHRVRRENVLREDQ
jgi:hypothetical protein